ncbi:unnamed protein product [Linum trigynum]|uniref:RNase H type-1 domain-containing protein n=1 Tax=Linum trigynum TaxID=586398 RepID=A0AAV2DW37_9ROSI
MVVCMWDAATRSGSHAAGGMVILNLARDILMAKGVQFPGIDDPAVVELLVLREAMLWCLEHGFAVVRLEGDAKVIIDKIRQADTSDNQMGAVLDEVVQYFAAHPGLSVRFVVRRYNRVAHEVARKALSLYPTLCRFFDFQTWLESRV